jgi:DNA (cytosine-5)-methyltransferase 1
VSAYYNENDPFAAAWLRELIKAGLIADGEVDERDIRDVRAEDVRGFTQCHFFAGIGGWSYALGLSGWPDDFPVFTGSCPCQPWSVAGKSQGADDSRDLWPSWLRIIAECRPTTVFGEQVTSRIARLWADRVAENLEALGYAIGAIVLPATCVGSPHQRDRLFFVADDRSADTTGRFPHGRRQPRLQKTGRAWAFENWNGGQGSIGGLDDGLPGRLAKSIVNGLGNAIVPQVGAAFVSAYLDVLSGDAEGVTTDLDAPSVSEGS